MLFCSLSLFFHLILGIIFNVICVLCFTGVSSEQELTPYTDVEVSSERDRVTLSCNYTSGDTLQWYRQHPKSAPQLLVMEYADITPGFTLSHDKNAKRTDLNISSAEVTDSALYYCDLRHKVTGNPEILYRNLEHLITGRKLSTGSKMNIS
uniref:Ig-like domain-containing protein n=1 Tax=Oncorhynchus mykiss TaxID=8022 RepID=A0A8K9V6G3_ONCMY